MAEGALLEVEGISKDYGGRTVVDRVSLRVGPGEMVGIFGRNGAGKSTTLRVVMGLARPTTGKVAFKGEAVTTLPVHQHSQRGMGFLAQGRSVFRRLLVEENLLAALEACPGLDRDLRTRAADLLHEYGLERQAGLEARALTGGEAKRLELCRAMASGPSLLILDEPFSGVDPICVGDLERVVKGIRSRGIAVLLTDHNVRERLPLCDRAYIPHEGRILAHGRPGDIEGPPPEHSPAA